MNIQRWHQRFKNLPYLLTPPVVSLLKNKWRDRDRILPDIPDHELYKPVFSPWLGNGEFGGIRDHMSRFTLVSPDRAWVLYKLAINAKNLKGDFVECGVYKGGTAHLLAHTLQNRDVRLHLFDTFSGMPQTNEEFDKHREGDFVDTSLETVKKNIKYSENVLFYEGYIPDTFKNIDIKYVAFLHIDLDIHDSIINTLDFFYNSVLPGGFVIFDDYGFESCYGARLAVDKFFSDKPEEPICLSTGQALVIKS